MSKQTLVDEISASTGIMKTTIAEVLVAVAETAKAAVKSQTDMTLPGIGKITTRQQAARTGRNPATKLPVDIPAKVAVSVKVAKALKDAAN